MCLLLTEAFLGARSTSSETRQPQAIPEELVESVRPTVEYKPYILIKIYSQYRYLFF